MIKMRKSPKKPKPTREFLKWRDVVTNKLRSKRRVLRLRSFGNWSLKRIFSSYARTLTLRPFSLRFLKRLFMIRLVTR
jgi:hypothetical protein